MHKDPRFAAGTSNKGIFVVDLFPLQYMQVSTVAQISLLEPVDSSPEEGPLCVVNTHLYFHPRANFIRTLHTAVMMMEARAVIDTTNDSAALIFCGDLNSGHNKGVPGRSASPEQQYAGRSQEPSRSILELTSICCSISTIVAAMSSSSTTSESSIPRCRQHRTPCDRQSAVELLGLGERSHLPLHEGHQRG